MCKNALLGTLYTPKCVYNICVHFYDINFSLLASPTYTMCASKRVRISCCDTIFTIYLSLCTLSADPNPFRGTHCSFTDCKIFTVKLNPTTVRPRPTSKMRPQYLQIRSSKGLNSRSNGGIFGTCPLPHSKYA